MEFQQKTYRLPYTQRKQKWYLVDARDKIVGRLAAQLSLLAMGKTEDTYAPNVDPEIYLVIINADQVRFTGKKMDNKIYRRFSNYPGHMKEIKAKHLMEKKPEEILRLAIKRMLPKNKIGNRIIHNIKVYAGSEHPHAAQKPQPYEV